MFDSEAHVEAESTAAFQPLMQALPSDNGQVACRQPV